MQIIVYIYIDFFAHISLYNIMDPDFYPTDSQGLKLQNIFFVHMFPTQKCIFWLNSRACLFNSKTKLIFSVQIYFFVQ